MAIVWALSGNAPKVLQVLLSKPAAPAAGRLAALYPQARAASCRQLDALASALAAVLEGTPAELPLEVVDLCRCGTFQRRVLLAEHGIPRGCVSTYRLLARHLGTAGGARAVGHALATNPFPLIVPCHRTIRTDGTLGGFQGGLAMKRALLQHEGVPFDRAGRVRGAPLCYGA